MSLLMRMAFYAALGVLLSLIFGWGLWAVVFGIIGALIGLAQMELDLNALFVVAAAVLLVVLALIGVGTFSTGWFVVGAIVAAFLFVLEAKNAFTPPPVHR